MYKKYHYNNWMIFLSFFIAILLQITPGLLKLRFFHPSWVIILLIYWLVIPAYQINIETGFILGLILDLIVGSTFGIHSLALSILIYLIISNFQLLHNMICWKQMLIVMCLSLITKIIIFLMEYITTNISFCYQVFWDSILDGILWPGLYLFMNKICYYCHISNE